MLQGQSQDGQRGFAIIVVLSFLLILTVLFAIATKRNQTQISTLSSEQTLLERQSEAVALLHIAANLNPELLISGEPITVPFGDGERTLIVQDVGGLIDLNTAAPDLLQLVFNHLELDEESVQKYRDWRRDGKRLLRVQDFLRVTGADPAKLDVLLQISTVHSGRRGLAVEHVPEELRQVLVASVISISSGLETAPSRVNATVYQLDNLQTSSGYLGLINAN